MRVGGRANGADVQKVGIVFVPGVPCRHDRIGLHFHCPCQVRSTPDFFYFHWLHFK